MNTTFPSLDFSKNETIVVVPFIDLRSIFLNTTTVLSMFGMFLNGLLLYLIFFKTAKNVSDYKIILLQNCLIDVFFNLINDIVKGQTDYKYGTHFLIASDWVKAMPYPYNCLIIGLWTLAFFCCITSIPVQFIYRYFIIVKGRIMTKIEYFIILLIAFIGAFIFAIASTMALWPEKRFDDAKALMLKSDPYYYQGIPFFMAAEIQRWPLKLCFAYAQILVNTSYGITIMSFYKVWKKLKTQAIHFSNETKKMHNQMTKTMILQAHVPVIFILIPSSCDFASTFFLLNIPGLGMILNLMCCWIPIANPLVTILSVKLYRKTIMFPFYKYILRRNQAHVMVSSAAVGTTSGTITHG